MTVLCYKMENEMDPGQATVIEPDAYGGYASDVQTANHTKVRLKEKLYKKRIKS